MAQNQELYPKLDKQAFQVKRNAAEKVPRKQKNNYKGCYYSVGFKVDREICLTGLEFFGSAEANYSSYQVRVMICRTEEKWSWISKMFQFFGSGPFYKTVVILPEYSVKEVNVRRGQTFLVNLPHPVTIQPNLWTEIKFELIGPDTECLLFSSERVKVVLGDSGIAKFDFTTGSRQLPAFYFIQK